MYNSRPNIAIGFHGCDESVRDKLVHLPDSVEKSRELFDWLGHGFYIWENNYERALQWARDKKKRGKIEKAAVLGVVYQLNYCLDFTDSAHTSILAKYYASMKDDLGQLGQTLPVNRDLATDKHKDLILRELDCAVIEYMHNEIEVQIQDDIDASGFSNLKSFDTVRGVFTEGGPAFEGAGIQLKTHIQICIRNLNCIKGFFVPRKKL